MNLKPGDIVFAKSDPRHTGIIRGTSNTGRRKFAFIEWLDGGIRNGLCEYRVPFSHLSLVRPESERGRNVFRYYRRTR